MTQGTPQDQTPELQPFSNQSDSQTVAALEKAEHDSTTAESWLTTHLKPQSSSHKQLHH